MKIEFFGPPGSGKTYLRELVTGENRQQIREKATNPILTKIKYLSRYSPISIVYRYKIRRILADEKLEYRYHDTSVNSMIDSIVLVATTYKLNLKAGKILDEGIIQRIISFGINYELSTKTIIQIIDLFKENIEDVRVIYVYLSVPDIIDSIKKRNRKESKMDFFDENVLINFVTTYEQVCNDVAEYFNFQRITRIDFEHFAKEYKEK